MSDLDVIKDLEKELGITINRREHSSIDWRMYNTSFFFANQSDLIIEISIRDVEIDNAKAFFYT